MGNVFNFEAIKTKALAIAATLLPKVISALLILVIGFLVIKLLVKILDRALNRFNLDVSLIKFLIKAVSIVLYVVLVISALAALGVSTTGMIAALSAAAVAVSLALKDSLSNIASGILLLITQPFKTGDFVEVGGVSGSVLGVDMIQTTILTTDNKRIIIPNSQVSSSEIINYSAEDMRRVDIVFSVSYDADVEKAKEAVLRVVNAHSAVKREHAEPFARVSGYGDSAVNITCRVWCMSADYWNLYFDLTEQVRAEFDKEGISIPYNQLDVHIVDNK